MVFSAKLKNGGKNIEKALSKVMSFIYDGENERPVRPLNFRDTKRGGLGLIEPMIKSKALFLKI